MYCIVYILLFTCFILRISCVPSGLKIGKVRNAKKNEYSFIVRLESRITLTFDDKICAENNVHICACAALRPTWSLTAGHCIDSASPMKDLTDNLRIQTVIRYGSINSSTAEVISTILHPSFHDPLLRMQNDIGLLRTEPIPLKKFAVMSSVDINTLGGYDVTLAGHSNTNGSLTIIGETDYPVERKPPQLLKASVVRFQGKNESTLPKKCVENRCVSSSSSECDGDSGGPMLHGSGVVGIITISLENIRLCSAVNKKGQVRMEFITPTGPHVKWINETIDRDAAAEMYPPHKPESTVATTRKAPTMKLDDSKSQRNNLTVLDPATKLPNQKRIAKAQENIRSCCCSDYYSTRCQ